ncbi:MAG TPA: hypothetical protein VGG16_13485 [Streptosporangiaceae bacterium]|jgi:Flp pilus assembly protein TadB
MTWGSGDAGPATRHNARVRGGGSWAEQTARLSVHQHRRYRRETGTGTWSDKNRHLDRNRRRQERDQSHLRRGAGWRNYGKVAVVGVLILGAVLLMSPATRGAAVVILVVLGLAMYTTTRRKHA